MPRFSTNSKRELATCHPILQDIFNEIILHYDCTIIQGHRTGELHKQYLKEGKTRVAYDKSKHRHTPSQAVDVSPYPIPDRWGVANKKEYARFHLFAGKVLGIAEAYGYKIRWGGDWDGDGETSDQTFDDLVHYEIVERKLR